MTITGSVANLSIQSAATNWTLFTKWLLLCGTLAFNSRTIRWPGSQTSKR